LSRNRLLLLVFIGILLCWSCLETLDSFQQRQFAKNREAEIRELFPLLRFRTDPHMLGRERLYTAVQGLNDITRSNAESIADHLQCELGPHLQVLLEDRDGHLLLSRGFASATLEPLAEFVRLRQLRENGVRFHDTATSSFHLCSAALAGVRQFTPLWNKWDVARVSLHGTPGLLLSGSVTATPFLTVTEFSKFFPLAPSLCQFQAESRGGFALFLPLHAVEPFAWFTAQAKRSPPGCSQEFWAGTPEELASGSPFPAPGIAALQQLSQTSSQFTLTQDGITLGVLRTRIPRPFFQIAFSRHPPSLRTTRTLPLLLLSLFSAVFLFIGGFRYCCPDHDWAVSVGAKWLFLSVLALVLPLLGTWWMLLSMDTWIKDWLVNNEFQHMERKIAFHENKMQEQAALLVTEMKCLQESFPWESACPSDAFLENMQQRLEARGIMRFFFVDRLGHFFTFRDTFSEWPVFKKGIESISRTPQKFSPLDQIMVWILSILERSLRFPPSKTSEMDDLKFGLMLESLKDSPESFLAIHYLLMSPGLLHDLRWMRSETSWAYGAILRDSFHQAVGIFLGVFKRNQLHEKFLWKMVLEHRRLRDTDTDFGFAWVNHHQVSMILPETLALHPAIQQTTLRLGQESGVQRAEIIMNGERRLLLSRPFHNIDAIAIVTHPHPAMGWRQISRGAMTAVAFTGYLLMVTLLLRRLFQQVYLAPMEEIRRGVVRMAAGEYDQPLDETRQNELGTLAARFNRMTSGLKEKEYFSRFLSDLTRSAVKASGNLPSTRLEAAVLFSDIRGFTTMSETLPPEQIVDLLNRHFTRMEACIEAEGGTIDKFIGDAIMAVFLPVHGREHPSRRAVAAGLRMLETLQEAQAAPEAQKTPLSLPMPSGDDSPGPAAVAAPSPQIRCGVGIATGEVLMGVLGRKDGRQDFTVTGRTVNQAALMEKITKQAQNLPLVVCEHTLRQAHGFTGIPLVGGSSEAPGFEITPPPGPN
jgi:class 3 adenylate cyclase